VRAPGASAAPPAGLAGRQQRLPHLARRPTTVSPTPVGGPHVHPAPQHHRQPARTAPHRTRPCSRLCRPAQRARPCESGAGRRQAGLARPRRVGQGQQRPGHRRLGSGLSGGAAGLGRPAGQGHPARMTGPEPLAAMDTPSSRGRPTTVLRRASVQPGSRRRRSSRAGAAGRSPGGAARRWRIRPLPPQTTEGQRSPTLSARSCAVAAHTPCSAAPQRPPAARPGCRRRPGPSAPAAGPPTTPRQSSARQARRRPARPPQRSARPPAMAQ